MAIEPMEPYVLDFPNGERVDEILKKAEADYSREEIDEKFDGLDLVGKTFEVDGKDSTGEIFNDYVNNVANGDYSHAEGFTTQASGQASHAEGTSTTASGDYSHAEGSYTIASGYTSHAEGGGNGWQYIFGGSPTASGYQSHAEGGGAVTASGDQSHAEGASTEATGWAGHSEGVYTKSNGEGAHAEGTYYVDSSVGSSSVIRTIADGAGAHAEGRGTYAQGTGSHAEGDRTKCKYTSQSHAEGLMTTLTYIDSAHAEGYQTSAILGRGHHVEGYSSVRAADKISAFNPGNSASGFQETWEESGRVFSLACGSEGCHVEGKNCFASGGSSHAEGIGTLAKANGSHAEGSATTASGQYSHAEGHETIASGTGAHSEGLYTAARGDNSHVEGYSQKKYTEVITISNVTPKEDIMDAWSRSFSLANGFCSHVEGFCCLGLGADSHAEGAYTCAYHDYSHAEGYDTTAKGLSSHAEGNTTYANGYASHSEGQGTIAASEYQHVQGRYNTEDSNNKYAFIIGNGAYSKRSNAIAIDWDGKIYVNNSDTGVDLNTVVQDISNRYTKTETDSAIATKISEIIANAPESLDTLKEIADWIDSHAGSAASMNSAIQKNTEDTQQNAEDIALLKETTINGVSVIGALDSQSNLKIAGKVVTGTVYQIDGEDVTAAEGAEVFNSSSNKASGSNSHAEGVGTTASGAQSHAEGVGTTASGYFSHAEGGGTTASGTNSHAEGDSTTASGANSHAEGSHTKASSNYQHVQGRYNIEDTDNKYAFIIGNGEDEENRSNAIAIDWSGKIYVNNAETGVDLDTLVSRIDQLGGGAEEFICNITADGFATGSVNNWTSDKTFDELKNAYDSGKKVRVILNNAEECILAERETYEFRYVGFTFGNNMGNPSSSITMKWFSISSSGVLGRVGAITPAS